MQRTARSAVTLAVVLAAALTPTACKRAAEHAATPEQGSAQKLSASEAENLRYVLANTSVGVPYKLNLADPKQYAYVEATLRRFGRTPERAPHLFQLLREARNGTPSRPVAVGTPLVPAASRGGDYAYLDRLQGSAGAAWAGSPPYHYASVRGALAQAPSSTAGGAVLQGINYTTDFARNQDGSYYTNAFSTYPDSQVPYNTHVMVSLVDPRSGNLLSRADSNVFSQTNVKVPVTAPAPADSSPVISNTLFLVAPQRGDPLEAYSVYLEDRVGVVSPCQLSPNYSTTGVQQCQTNSNGQCVNSAPPTRRIKVCYGNRIQNDCDYGCQGSSYPPNIIFPIQGSVVLGQQPLKPLTGSVNIVLQDLAGGGCVLQATQNSLPLDSVIHIDSTSTVASWNLTPATFPNQNCLQPGGMVMNYLFQLFVQTRTSYAGVTFTSDTSQARNPATVIVPQLDIVEGCLPGGVKIRMEDGTEKRVESFQGYGNERVRSGSPATRAVTATTRGSEARPLVSLRTSRGHSLLLTEMHPVITNRGPVMAVQLRRGDVVLTEGGEATLVEVGRRANPHPVPVHNLRVGTEEEAVRGRTTFYANGILVGDQLMQRHLHLQSRMPRVRSREQILSELPREWHRDFLNARP